MRNFRLRMKEKRMKTEHSDPAIPELWQSLPNMPGVYLMKASDGTVLYVGKAVRLRTRVRSYFREKFTSALTSQMMRYVTEIDYIVTETEVEALILENNLIKAHQPRYNVKLKDDKRYPYLRVTVNEAFPRIHITRKAENDGTRYFGPFVHARSTRQTLKQLTKLFPIRTCTLPLSEVGNRYRVCLDYHIGRCPGPCADKIDVSDYDEIVRKVCQFLNGNTDAVVKELTEQMQAAAAALDFETAAKYRDTLKDVQQAITTQNMDSVSAADEDVIGIAVRTDIACVQLLRVRDGKLLEREHYYLKDVDPASLATALSAFISQYYQNAVFVPKTVVLPMPIASMELIENWLSEKQGNRRVGLHVPKAGRLRKLQILATKNAEILLTQREQNVGAGLPSPYNGVDPALVELQELLGLKHPLRRIEAYDISNLGDRFAVGSMVVLEDGKPASSEYRRFKIRSVKGQNDFAMMREVITRRFRRALADDEKFNTLPDLMLIDGGKGQLSAAQTALKTFASSRLPDIPLIALAKRIEEIFVPGKSEPIVLREDNPTLHMIQRLRDEAHRFAVTYHRRLRQKSLSVSVLDEIPNLGPKRKQALLQHFGSIEAIRAASLDGLLSVKGIPRSVAENIRKHL